MPTEWSEGIFLCDLADEPELSEELSAVFGQLKKTPPDKLPHVVLNFGGVSYMNSSQIAALLRLRKLLAEAAPPKQLVLAALQDEVWSVLLLTGLDKVFQVSPDTMTALARVQLDGADGTGSA
ncbi:MAG TPA: STAS domain-containing protein [Phycisphaerales bacterium]|nr:STAS domain-containing protein [Phycisphaerales bacterium]